MRVRGTGVARRDGPRQIGAACAPPLEPFLEETGDPMADEHFLAQLWATIESRKADESASKSYTRQLLASPPRIRRKIIEEAYEVNEAHQSLTEGQDTKDHLAHEAADLLYHLLVLLSSADVT